MPCDEQGGLAANVIGRPDVWRLIANALPLGSRAACFRVCRALAAEPLRGSRDACRWCAEVDGFDLGVATVCCMLAKEKNRGVRRLCERAPSGLDELQARKMEVLSLCRRRQRRHSNPYTWVKLALECGDDEWLFRGALKIRMEFAPAECELQWGELHLAAVRGEGRAVRELLERGRADVDARDFDGRTAMHLAAMKGRADTAGLLLAGGADRAARSRTGSTPLICAAQRGHYECAKVLLSPALSSAIGAGAVGCPLDVAVSPALDGLAEVADSGRG